MKGWGGRFCNSTYTCDNYCFNGGTCRENEDTTKEPLCL